MNLAIARHQTDLWLAFPNEIRDAALLGRYWELLNDAEKAQQKRFYFEKDRHRYLVTRALVRTVLSRYAPVEPAHWTFEPNAWGRPRISNAALALSFNISHTDDLVVCAVTGPREIGVDVENILRRQPTTVDIARGFFSPSECDELFAHAPENRQARFFYYWTLKEAYIKARGMGLSLPLDRFSYAFPGADGISLSIEPDLEDDPGRWYCWLLQPTPAHLLALCVERMPAANEAPRTRKVVPLLSEAPFSCPVLRRSRP